MDRVWFESYPEGIPHVVDMDAYRSLADIIDTSCARFASRPAYENMGVTLRYQDLDRLSRDFAAWLQSEIGLQKGDRVALMMPNLLQYPIAAFGVLRAGGVVVNVNPLYKARELAHILEDSGARLIVVLENFAHTLAELPDQGGVEHALVTRIGDLLPGIKRPLVNLVVKRIKKMVPAFQLPRSFGFRDALTRGAELSYDPPPLSHADLAFLQYTGGTTGSPKGAELTHGNMVANLQQASAWLSPVLVEEEEVVITALPLYHIFSLTANCLVFLKIGGLNVLITNPRDIPAFIKVLQKTPFTVITGVNTLFNALLAAEGFAELDFSRLKLALGGGMAVQRSVAERWQRVTGLPLVEAYGLTEASPAVCVNPLDNKHYNGSIGLPIPSTDLIVRAEDGSRLPIGEVGEICVRGPQVMQGYWQQPEETREVLSAEGWLATGDIGLMDNQGYFYIQDRKKDMILVSGFNVYPNEVEDVAADHPGVREVAAIGVPDEKSGESVKLFVVKEDEELSAEALIAHCRAQMAGYKCPRLVEFRDELPKTNVGKIMRRALREPPTEV